MKKCLSLLLAWALMASLSVTAFAAGTSFSDVPTTNTFYDAIMWCSGNGIVYGYGGGIFKPAGTVSRSNFVVMLSRAFYADEVALYSGEPFNYTGTMPNIMAMNINHILDGTSFQYDSYTADVMSLGINRYDMAQLMTNIMNANGFAAGSAEKDAAVSKITDYSGIPSEYRDAVANVYALGIITGFGDGSFGGEGIMTRGQACVVIYRMLQKFDASGSGNTVNPEPETPVDPSTPSTPVQPETPSTPDTPDTPDTPAGATLSNGKAITEANVTELLNQLKTKYPQSTSFANGYAGMGTGLNANNNCINKIISPYTGVGGYKCSTTIGCGGWAALIADALYGQTNVTWKKTTLENIRPGDLMIKLDSSGYLTHVMICTGYVSGFTTTQKVTVTTADPNSSGVYSIGWANCVTLGASYDVYTAYPN